MNARTLRAVLAVVVAIAAVGGALAYWHAAAPPAPTAPAPTTTGSTAPTSPTPTTSAPTTSSPTAATLEYAVALTDPPSVPAGTSAVLINYSGVAVQAEGYGWIYANASGSVNLLALQNLSVVIAQVSVPANATVNEVRLYVTNASILVNGTEYPLMLPSGVLTIPIANASRAARGALVDLQPHVTVAYVGDQPVFIMAPAAVAVPLNYTAPPGTVLHVPEELRDELGRSAANVTVTSAVIRVAGNETIVSVTVRNDGSEPVQVLGVGVKGNWSLSVPPITIRTEGLNATIQVSGATAEMHMVFFVNGTQLVPALEAAAPHLEAKWFLPPHAKAREFRVEWEGNATEFDHDMEEWWGNMSRSGPGLVTIAGPNGTTLVNASQLWRWNFTPPAPSGLPGPGRGNWSQWPAAAPAIADSNVTHESDEHLGPSLNVPGYTLGPGQSATFTFEGVIALGPRLDIGGSSGPITITIAPIAGQSYGITVMTIPASNATATATAG
ncbi:MAG: DUF4382 domain-containing protein [Nitrososphaeria archaeon]